MISITEFLNKLDNAGIRYVHSPVAVTIVCDHALMFSFENDSMVSYVNKYVLRRLWDVREVIVTPNKITIQDGPVNRYELIV